MRDLGRSERRGQRRRWGLHATGTLVVTAVLLGGCGAAAEMADPDDDVVTVETSEPAPAPQRDTSESERPAREEPESDEADADEPAPGPEPDEEDDTDDEPTGLERLADDCADGDFAACDDLYRESPVGSDEERFGDTCGGRFEPGSGAWCVERLEGSTGDDDAGDPPTSDDALDEPASDWRDVVVGRRWLSAPRGGGLGEETWTIIADGRGGHAFWVRGFGGSNPGSLGITGTGNENPIVWNLDGSQLTVQFATSGAVEPYQLVGYDPTADVITLRSDRDPQWSWHGCRSAAWPRSIGCG